ncbi:MAG: carboxylating nicotinate-nucleotide diphosphorylase [Bauldia sp.]
MAVLAPPPSGLMADAVRTALAEDLGRAGDVTSTATIPADMTTTAEIVTRKPGVLSGIPLAVEAFRQIDPALAVTMLRRDGETLMAADAVLRVSGNARSILAAERVALNFLTHLSGVATATAAFAEAIRDTDARIVCTRKTIPGLRAFQKYAVRCGGGANHRFGLDDAVLIKDNHIAVAGGVVPAIERARAGVGHLVRVEVEVDTLDQLREALTAGPDAVLLDNMSLDALREAVAIAGGQVVLEASGGVTLSTVRAIAETGVDLISSGWITHSAPALDLGLDIADP